MTVLIVLAAVAVIAVPVVVLVVVVVGRRPAPLPAKDAARERFYVNYERTYQHPRSTR